ncbi:MAG: DUF58 domain-containing protein [Planctomycetales bacterium]|nr:DUF58 domain-containing protein [Planctomycetales bacterium]
MDTSLKSLDPRTLAKLGSLRLRARHIVEGYVSGLHRSPYRGFSIEFAEHREYAPGDDLRHVDWKVFGRSDKFYLKQYEDETNLICYLVLDISESMQYRGPDAAMSKLEYAQTVAAAMAWLVLQQQDSIGLVTFDNQIRTLIRPGSNPSHLSQILQVLESVRPQAKTRCGPIFHELAERLKKRGVVLLLSDFFDDVASLSTGLKHLRHRRHDVIAAHVLDAAELDFPFTQPTMFKGLEQMPEVMADARSLRRAYLAEFDKFLTGVRNTCRGQAIDYQQMRTDRPFDVTLSDYLATRAARIK